MRADIDSDHCKIELSLKLAYTAHLMSWSIYSVVRGCFVFRVFTVYFSWLIRSVVFTSKLIDCIIRCKWKLVLIPLRALGDWGELRNSLKCVSSIIIFVEKWTSRIRLTVQMLPANIIIQLTVQNRLYILLCHHQRSSCKFASLTISNQFSSRFSVDSSHPLQLSFLIFSNQFSCLISISVLLM